jgi:NADH dehydrogenase ubiquinone Fe-S protein 4
MLARIFRPARTAMQSGKAKTEHWMLVYEPETPLSVEPLMGYTSSGDMLRQIKLSFDSKEEAIAYAERNGIPYQVQVDHEGSPTLQSYSDNFRFGRPQPWTH